MKIIKKARHINESWYYIARSGYLWISGVLIEYVDDIDTIYRVINNLELFEIESIKIKDVKEAL